MRRIIWAKPFKKALKRNIQKKPELLPKVEKSLRLLADDPFDPELHSHRLKGKLDGLWACKVDYDSRILFMFIENPETGMEDLLLVSMGTHQEVY